MDKENRDRNGRQRQSSVVRSHAFGTHQKLWQLCLVWFLPFVGATVVHWVVTNGSGQLPVPDREFIRQDIPPPGVTRVRW